MSNYFDDLRRQLDGGGRTDLSRRREADQIAQRQRNGELAPGQRSQNQPWRD
jgi:hypothetical protein